MPRTCLLLLLLLLPAGADDLAQLRRLGTTWGRVTDARQAGDYALLTWEQSEAAGQVLLRKIDGRWRELTGGGGAIDGGLMWQYGVPEATIRQLLPDPGDLAQARRAGPYWTWLTRERTVTDQDLEGWSAFELTLARNEIFAVHGRPFRDPLLAAYFRSRSWYRANPAWSEALLSPRERRNAAFIADYQQRKRKNL